MNGKQEFTSRGGSTETYIEPELSGLADIDPTGHGTGVASLVGGAQLGVAKDATIIGVKFVSNGYMNIPVQNRAMRWIIQDVRNKGRQGKAVIVYPWSSSSSCLACIAHKLADNESRLIV